MGTYCMTGNFESHLLISGRGEGMQPQSITNGQWLNQSCLCKEASIKPKRDRFQRVSMLVTVEIWGEWCARKKHGSSTSFPRTLPYTSLPSGYSFFNSVFFFLLEGTCFTMLWWSLLYINENQSWLYTPPPCSASLPPHSTPLGHHRLPGWVPCILQQLLTSYTPGCSELCPFVVNQWSSK